MLMGNSPHSPHTTPIQSIYYFLTLNPLYDHYTITTSAYLTHRHIPLHLFDRPLLFLNNHSHICTPKHPTAHKLNTPTTQTQLTISAPLFCLLACHLIVPNHSQTTIPHALLRTLPRSSSSSPVLFAFLLFVLSFPSPSPLLKALPRLPFFIVSIQTIHRCLGQQSSWHSLLTRTRFDCFSKSS